ncbi:MAG: RNA polymerase subunit sigma-70 [Polyangiales bacterium]
MITGKTAHASLLHSSYNDQDLAAAQERHRRELRGYCYRMLGSAFDADDAVQDSFMRACRGLERFEGRSSLRSWLYRLATSVCLDMINARERRVLPLDYFGARWSTGTPVDAAADGRLWIEPIPDVTVLPAAAAPSALLAEQKSIHLACIAALQHLPARQRAVLILRDVLSWSAHEVADLLGASEIAVHSALLRARASLDAAHSDKHLQTAPSEIDPTLVERYMDAFTRSDVERIIALLHHDVTMSMPPYALWLSGTHAFRNWFLGPGARCAGSKLVRVAANGSPAFAQYRPNGASGTREAFAIHVLHAAEGRVAAVHTFVNPALFKLFGLPPTAAS